MDDISLCIGRSGGEGRAGDGERGTGYVVFPRLRKLIKIWRDGGHQQPTGTELRRMREPGEALHS